MCFLRFNKYKVKHMSSVKLGHMGNFEPNSINTIFLDQNPTGSSSSL